MAKKQAQKKKTVSKAKTATSSKTSSKKTTTNEKVKFEFKDTEKATTLAEKIEFCEHNIGELHRYSNMLIDSVALDSPLKEKERVNTDMKIVSEKMMRIATKLGGYRQDQTVIENAKANHVDTSISTDAPVDSTAQLAKSEIEEAPVTTTKQ